jgi:preprotein translocase subunit SecA
MSISLATQETAAAAAPAPRDNQRRFAARWTLYLRAMFGLPARRRLAYAALQIGAVRWWEHELDRLSDAALHEHALQLRGRARGGHTLDQLLPEAFGAVCVALRRHTGLRPFDVQVAAGVVIHHGAVAEVATGEGKTLIATMPVYLNALTGRGVHVATVNDYLARRDAEWFGPVYRALAISVGVVNGEEHERALAYRQDITYAPAAEFGFDFLRDRLKLRGNQYPQADLLAPWRAGDQAAFVQGNPSAARVQREHHFALVDEADNIFVDDARTPLLITTGASNAPAKPEDVAVYAWADRMARQLTPGLHFYQNDEKQRLELTQQGQTVLRWSAPPAGPESPRLDKLFEHLERSLHAHHRFRRDQHYMVEEDKVIILDEGTGRQQPSRHWTEGLHQAVEAKEGVAITQGGGHSARVTFQAYFRLYEKLGGMTGTAAENTRELRRVYSLRVVKVPTNRPVVRQTWPPRIYATEPAMFDAIVQEVLRLRDQGRPLLIGTSSLERSERLSGRFTDAGIAHQVLNAKYHEMEAKIIAQAGQRGRVTIATNMAGRGTDIILGPGVAEAGGLHVILTQMHDSARGDRQFQGRAGRQGDPGSARFFLSFDDQILEAFPEEDCTRLRRWALRMPWESLQHYFHIFRKAQRLRRKKHYRQRVDLMIYEKRRDKLLKSLGADPYVD